jgi:hypothetical protein
MNVAAWAIRAIELKRQERMASIGLAKSPRCTCPAQNERCSVTLDPRCPVHSANSGEVKS